ncbi:MAG: hypothetical protein RH946_04265 [Rhodospirillales bacterium]
MFAHIEYRYTRQTVQFIRGVVRLLGFRRHRHPVVFRTPPSAR